MNAIKSLAVLISLSGLLIAPMSYAVNGMSASCRITSSDYLSDGEIDTLTELYQLTAPAIQDGGRQLVYQTDRYELWLKTSSYRKDEQGLTITGFASVVLDKSNRTMSESASSAQSVPQRSNLTLHHLSPEMIITSRLIFSCTEYREG